LLPEETALPEGLFLPSTNSFDFGFRKITTCPQLEEKTVPFFPLSQMLTGEQHRHL